MINSSTSAHMDNNNIHNTHKIHNYSSPTELKYFCIYLIGTAILGRRMVSGPIPGNG